MGQEQSVGKQVGRHDARGASRKDALQICGAHFALAWEKVKVDVKVFVGSPHV